VQQDIFLDADLVVIDGSNGVQRTLRHAVPAVDPDHVLILRHQEFADQLVLCVHNVRSVLLPSEHLFKDGGHHCF
jgi:hypothetical protein